MRYFYRWIYFTGRNRDTSSDVERQTMPIAEEKSTKPGLDLPLGVLSPEDEPFCPKTVNRLVWALLFLGLAARLVRYGLQFPIWQDEAYLAMNYLGRGYLGLAGNLDCHQVCPLLFLWTEYTFVKLLGFSVASLRLFPLLCGVGSLFLFRHLAGRLLRGTALLFAVAIFAASYPLIRYGCEAKPYSCDVFFSLAMLSLAVQWWQCRATRWLWFLAALAPFALGFSFPCVFTAGGISLAIAFVLLKERVRNAWMPWIAYNASLLAGFCLLYAVNVRNQTAGELQWMRDYWQNIFPPLDSALGFIKWSAVVHTSEMLQHPVGGARGASILTAICCFVALAVLWRKKQYVFAAFCLFPLLPNLVAAAIKRYPYGGHVRFALYLTPAICLLAGLGGAAILAGRKKRGAAQMQKASAALLVLLATVIGISIVRDFAFPYRTASVRRHRDFARLFWQNHNGTMPTVCWERDFAEGGSSPMLHSPAAALYLCNREIYANPKTESDKIVPGKAFRFVRFSIQNPEKTKTIVVNENDEKAFEAWLESIRNDYVLVDQQKFELPIITARRERNAKPSCFDTPSVYVFSPKEPAAEIGRANRSTARQ